MTLVTSFSLEELDYLRDLADFPDKSEHIGDCQQLGWQRFDYGLFDSYPCLDAGHPGCRDLWVHGTGDVVYYRHGHEALAKIIGLPLDAYILEPDLSALHKWLDSVHAHSQVLVP